MKINVGNIPWSGSLPENEIAMGPPEARQVTLVPGSLVVESSPV